MSEANSTSYCNKCSAWTDTREWDCQVCGLSKPMTATKPREFWTNYMSMEDSLEAAKDNWPRAEWTDLRCYAEASALLAKDLEIKELILVNAEVSEGFWNRGHRINELEEELKSYKMGSRFEAKEGDDARSENARLRELLSDFMSEAHWVFIGGDFSHSVEAGEYISMGGFKEWKAAKEAYVRVRDILRSDKALSGGEA